MIDTRCWYLTEKSQRRPDPGRRRKYLRQDRQTESHPALGETRRRGNTSNFRDQSDLFGFRIRRSRCSAGSPGFGTAPSGGGTNRGIG